MVGAQSVEGVAAGVPPRSEAGGRSAETACLQFAEVGCHSASTRAGRVHIVARVQSLSHSSRLKIASGGF